LGWDESIVDAVSTFTNGCFFYNKKTPQKMNIQDDKLNYCMNKALSSSNICACFLKWHLKYLEQNYSMYI
jgi:hypothetical protein